MVSRIVATTFPKIKKAKRISNILLENKLASCIQLTEIESFYIWM